MRNIINVSALCSIQCPPIACDRNEEYSYFSIPLFCIDESIGYRTGPDSFGKHESLSDSHIIKQLFWGIQFKLGLISALVGGKELLCLSTLFDSESILRESSRNKTQDLTRREAQS